MVYEVIKFETSNMATTFDQELRKVVIYLVLSRKAFNGFDMSNKICFALL